MKKFLIIFLVFFIMIFLLPAIFTKKYNNKTGDRAKEEDREVIANEDKTKEEANVDNEPYSYSKHDTVKLLHSKTGEIEELPLDTYLLGVVSAEMPAHFEQQALNAQAVVARTYTIYSIEHNNNKHEGADICDNANCCQAWISKDDRLAKWEENVRDEYWNKIESAVGTTKGKIITYEGEPIDAFFHSNSGGITETPVNVWGGTNFPYLQSVQTAGEDAYAQYSSEITISKEELINKIKQKHSNFEINFNQEDCIKILEYTDSSRVKIIKIGNLQLSGVELRGLIRIKVIKLYCKYKW